MAIKASFSPGAGLLSVFGDAAKNTVTVSRNAAGTLLVNGGAVAVAGGPVDSRQYRRDRSVRPGW